MAWKPIDEITDVDVKVSDGLGIVLNDHSGVVELVVRHLEHQPLSCGCCEGTVETYATVEVSDMDLARIVDGFGKLRGEYYAEHLDDSLAWYIRHGRHHRADDSQ